MSRRAILWLMVLFLGLTGIPMVYCILTWSPPEPLRFRITRDLGPVSTGDTRLLASFTTPATRELEVEVENTRSVTIQFHGATLWVPPGSAHEQPFFAQLDLSSEASRSCSHVGVGTSAGGSGSGSGRSPAASILYGARSSGSSIARASRTVSIPSHRTRSFRVQVLEGTSPSLSATSTHAGELRVQYLWTSQPRHVTSRALTWIRLHLPPIFRQHVPRIIPDENSTTIQLSTAGPGTS